MSERGSFATEYVYCRKCFEVLRHALLDPDSTRFLSSYTWRLGDRGRPSTRGRGPSTRGRNEGGGDFPIITGFLSGMSSGEEFLQVETFGEDVAPLLCHEVRIAVLSDTAGSRIYGIGPNGERARERGVRVLASHPFDIPILSLTPTGPQEESGER